MNALARRYGSALTGLCVGLTTFWLLMLVILPYFGLFEQSFRPYLPVVDVGGPLDTYSFNNYLSFFTSPIHIQVFLTTIAFSCIVTVFSLLVAYPISYFMAKVVSANNLPTLFMMLIIPMWVSEILRAFAWFIILALKGPLTIILQAMGIISEPIHWMWGLWGYSGVVVGLIYTYILFMLFPLYNAMTSLDGNQIEAAEDLGASRLKTHWRVIIPHSKPGIASGCVTVFMLAAGSVIVPTLLQSPRSRWFTEIIQQWMFESQDWQTGAAYAFLLLIICTVFVTLMMRLFKVSLADIAK
jgi:spermidine/putrescine transport system permease protein